MDLVEKIFKILVEEAQHDLQRKLGEKIVMTPDEVREILRKHKKELI